MDEALRQAYLPRDAHAAGLALELLDGLLALCLAWLVDSLPNALWLGALLACGLPLLRRLFALQRIASHAPEVPASLRGKPLQLILAGLLCLALTSLEPLLLP